MVSSYTIRNIDVYKKKKKREKTILTLFPSSVHRYYLIHPLFFFFSIHFPITFNYAMVINTIPVNKIDVTSYLHQWNYHT